MSTWHTLRDQGPELHSEGYEKEEPVEEDDAVWIARPPMLNILYGKYEAGREHSDDCRPESEISSPNMFVVFDLEDGLEDEIDDEGSNDGLRDEVSVVTHSSFKWIDVQASHKNANSSSQVVKVASSSI
jgi:hypothetical protein